MLERSVNELFELALELQTIVKAQGEMLDNVAENLKATEVYVEQAQMKMEHAEDINQGNKKHACVLICCLSCVAIIFVILLSGLIPF